MSDTKLVLKSIADACDRESLARAGGCLVAGGPTACVRCAEAGA